MPEPTNLNYVEHETFTLVERLNAPDIYADGLTHILVGFPTTKIVFHTTIDKQEEKEIRKVCLNLSLSTLAAVHLANSILSAYKQSEAALMDGLQNQIPVQLKELLADVVAKPDIAVKKVREKK